MLEKALQTQKYFILSKSKHFLAFIISFGLIFSSIPLKAQSPSLKTNDPDSSGLEIRPGAYNTELYLPLLKGKRIALVGNQTSMIGKVHLADSLLSLHIKLKKIFSPEHGFRGTEDAGAKIKTHIDKKSGLPIISLYGKNYKPKAVDLADVDLVVFDIQDVGVRFYTYLSTLHYVMEACAENNKPLIVLDRPNPNGFYIDGPVMEESFHSFVGLHPVPIVYGMTIGEYASMINGEGWLHNQVKCDLRIIQLSNYTHRDYYCLPVNPSPNLRNMGAIYLYPSLALFEGTRISVGRGTEYPFQVVGSPFLKNAPFSFTPKSGPGAANPMYKDTVCYGYDLRDFCSGKKVAGNQLNLYWLLETYKNTENKEGFFNHYFNTLTGNAILKQQVIDGKSEEEIRASWEADLNKFKSVRKKYLLYKDFE